MSSSGICPWFTTVRKYVNDIPNSTDFFKFHLFAGDSNLFCTDRNLLRLEEMVNTQLVHVSNWLCVNKLFLNLEKFNFIIFHPVQRKLNSEINIAITGYPLKQQPSTTYLSVVVDCHLNWKAHASSISHKIKRNIGAISKVRNYVNKEIILINLYYTLIYPFLTYALVVWGNTYPTTIDTLFTLQKKSVRIITFSGYYDPTNPIFNKLEFITIHDLVNYSNVIFMYHFYHGNLPEYFNSFFELLVRYIITVLELHQD